MSTSPVKPRMTLDAFKAAQSALAPTSARVNEVMEMMDAFQNAAARTGYGTSNLLEGSSYPFNRITLSYILLTSLYRGHWLIRKIVDAISDDMYKNWLDVISEKSPQQIKKFDKVIDETGTVAKLSEATKWGRLYGGAGAVMIISGDDDFEEPIVPEEVPLGSYKGLLVFDRWSGIAPGATICTNIEDPINFQLPEYYQITTQHSKVYRVHCSRVLRFTGPRLPNWEWVGNQYWGASVVESMHDELKKRDNTSFNIASMIFRALIFELQSPTMDQMLSGLNGPGGAAQRFYNVLQAQTQLMSNNGLFITGKDQALRTHQYSFGGLGEIYSLFMLDICASTEYPMTRLFGRTQTGLGQGNEGDEHSYYDLVGQRQKTEVDPNLRKLLPVIAMSTWGKIPKDFEWKWRPVRALTNEEEADLADKLSKPIFDAKNAGIIGRKTSLMELKSQSETTGLFTNITDQDIDEADNEDVNMAGEGGMPGMGGGPGGDEGSATDLLISSMEEEGGGEKKTQDAAEKMTKKEVSFQHPAQGMSHCGQCKYFQGNSCSVVEGKIGEDDWCEEFSRMTTDAAPWEESKHARAGKGQTHGKSKGGQFVSKGQGGGGSSASSSGETSAASGAQGGGKMAGLKKRLEAL